MVKIVWMDGMLDPKQYTKSEVEKLNLQTVETVGFFFSEDKSCIRLFAEFMPKDLNDPTDENMYRTIHIIPKGCIVKMVDLKEGGE